MKKLLLLLLLLPGYASACDLLVHTVSQHFNLPAHHIKVNEVNFGLGLECGHYVGGVYNNSFFRASVYGARKFGNNYGVVLGAVTGYPTSRGFQAVEPLVEGYVSIPVGKDKVNLSFTPPMKNFVGVVAVTLQFPLR